MCMRLHNMIFYVMNGISLNYWHDHTIIANVTWISIKIKFNGFIYNCTPPYYCMVRTIWSYQLIPAINKHIFHNTWKNTNMQHKCEWNVIGSWNHWSFYTHMHVCQLYACMCVHGMMHCWTRWSGRVCVCMVHGSAWCRIGTYLNNRWPYAKSNCRFGFPVCQLARNQSKTAAKQSEKKIISWCENKMQNCAKVMYERRQTRIVHTAWKRDCTCEWSMKTSVFDGGACMVRMLHVRCGRVCMNWCVRVLVWPLPMLAHFLFATRNVHRTSWISHWWTEQLKRWHNKSLLKCWHVNAIQTRSLRADSSYPRFWQPGPAVLVAPLNRVTLGVLRFSCDWQVRRKPWHTQFNRRYHRNDIQLVIRSTSMHPSTTASTKQKIFCDFCKIHQKIFWSVSHFIGRQIV